MHACAASGTLRDPLGPRRNAVWQISHPRPVWRFRAACADSCAHPPRRRPCWAICESENLSSLFIITGIAAVIITSKCSYSMPILMQYDEAKDFQPQSEQSQDEQHKGFPPHHDISEKQL